MTPYIFDADALERARTGPTVQETLRKLDALEDKQMLYYTGSTSAALVEHRCRELDTCHHAGTEWTTAPRLVRHHANEAAASMKSTLWRWGLALDKPEWAQNLKSDLGKAARTPLEGIRERVFPVLYGLERDGLDSGGQCRRDYEALEGEYLRRVDGAHRVADASRAGATQTARKRVRATEIAQIVSAMGAFSAGLTAWSARIAAGLDVGQS